MQQSFNNFNTQNFSTEPYQTSQENMNSYALALVRPELAIAVTRPSFTPNARVPKSTSLTYSISTTTAINSGLLWLTWHNKAQRGIFFDYLVNPGAGLPAGNYFREVAYESEDISTSYTRGGLVSAMISGQSSAVSSGMFSLAGKWFVGTFDSLPDIRTATTDSLPGSTSIAGGQRINIPIAEGAVALSFPLEDSIHNALRPPFSVSNVIGNSIVCASSRSNDFIVSYNSGTQGNSNGFSANVTNVWTCPNILPNFFGRITVTGVLRGTFSSTQALVFTLVGRGLVSNLDGTGALSSISNVVCNTIPNVGLAILTQTFSIEIEFPFLLHNLQLICNTGTTLLLSVITVEYQGVASDGYSNPSSIMAWSGCIAQQNLVFAGVFNYYLTPNSTLTKQVSAHIDDSQADDSVMAHRYLSVLQKAGYAGAYSKSEYDSDAYSRVVMGDLRREKLRGYAAGFGEMMGALATRAAPYLRKAGAKALNCLKEGIRDGGYAASFPEARDLSNSASYPSSFTELAEVEAAEGSDSSFDTDRFISTEADRETERRQLAEDEWRAALAAEEEKEIAARQAEQIKIQRNESIPQSRLETLALFAAAFQASMGPPVLEDLSQPGMYDHVIALFANRQAELNRNAHVLPVATQNRLMTKLTRAPNSNYQQEPHEDGGFAASFQNFMGKRLPQRNAPLGQAPEAVIFQDVNQCYLDTLPSWLSKKESSVMASTRNQYSQTGKRMPFSENANEPCVAGFYVVVYEQGAYARTARGYIVISKRSLDYRPKEDYQRGMMINYSTVTPDTFETVGINLVTDYLGRFHIDERIEQTHWGLLNLFNTTEADTSHYFVTRVDMVNTLGDSWTLAMFQAAKNVPSYHYYSGVVVPNPSDRSLSSVPVAAVDLIEMKILGAPKEVSKSFFAVTGMLDAAIVSYYEVAEGHLSNKQYAGRPGLPLLLQNLVCGSNPINFITSIEQIDQILFFCKEKMSSVTRPPAYQMEEGYQSDFLSAGGQFFLVDAAFDWLMDSGLDQVTKNRISDMKANEEEPDDKLATTLNNWWRKYTGVSKGKKGNAPGVQGNNVSPQTVVKWYSESSTGFKKVAWEDLVATIQRFSLMTALIANHTTYPQKLAPYLDKDAAPLSVVRSGLQYVFAGGQSAPYFRSTYLNGQAQGANGLTYGMDDADIQMNNPPPPRARGQEERKQPPPPPGPRAVGGSRRGNSNKVPPPPAQPGLGTISLDSLDLEL